MFHVLNKDMIRLIAVLMYSYNLGLIKGGDSQFLCIFSLFCSPQTFENPVSFSSIYFKPVVYFSQNKYSLQIQIMKLCR